MSAGRNSEGASEVEKDGVLGDGGITCGGGQRERGPTG